MGFCTCGRGSCPEDHKCKWHSPTGENEYLACVECAKLELRDAKREHERAASRYAALAKEKD